MKYSISLGFQNFSKTTQLWAPKLARIWKTRLDYYYVTAKLNWLLWWLRLGFVNGGLRLEDWEFGISNVDWDLGSELG